MANPVVVLDDTLYDIADAIRAKTGGSADMTPGQMPTEIASIPSGGGIDLSGFFNISKGDTGSFVGDGGSSHTITHNLGETPKIFIFSSNGANNSGSVRTGFYASTGGTTVGVWDNNSAYSEWSPVQGSTTTTITVSSGYPDMSIGGVFQNGATYKWIALA